MCTFLLFFNLIQQIVNDCMQGTVLRANENEEICIREFLLSNVLKLEAEDKKEKIQIFLIQ